MKPRFRDFYMNMAWLCSKMSRAERLKVGCVIIKHNNIISQGWNGTPSGWDNICETMLPEQIDPDSRTITPAQLVTKPEVLHAEMNALMKLARGSESGLGASLFVTHSPCMECSKGAYQAGIKEVYYMIPYRNKQGIEFLEKCGIPVYQVPEIPEY